VPVVADDVAIRSKRTSVCVIVAAEEWRTSKGTKAWAININSNSPAAKRNFVVFILIFFMISLVTYLFFHLSSILA
jgi:hypothetical protein